MPTDNRCASVGFLPYSNNSKIFIITISYCCCTSTCWWLFPAVSGWNICQQLCLILHHADVIFGHQNVQSSADAAGWYLHYYVFVFLFKTISRVWSLFVLCLFTRCVCVYVTFWPSRWVGSVVQSWRVARNSASHTSVDQNKTVLRASTQDANTCLFTSVVCMRSAAPLGACQQKITKFTKLPLHFLSAAPCWSLLNYILLWSALQEDTCSVKSHLIR